ncbi:MAG: hypothetical protein IKD96_03770 [Oscillospiraceae bacterium]|nr:hypothetical protein [Oscillospiraceae bacterium]
MKNLHWQSCTVPDSAGRPLSLSYSLLVDEVPCGASLLLENYGIRIDISGGDSISLPGITPLRREIEDLLALMCRNAVTPATAMDVTEDWLALR